MGAGRGACLAALVCVMLAPVSLDAGGLALPVAPAAPTRPPRPPPGPLAPARTWAGGLRLRGGEPDAMLGSDSEDAAAAAAGAPAARPPGGKMTDQEQGMANRADYIIRAHRSEANANLTYAMAHAAFMRKESAVVFLARGMHNLTREGEIRPPCEVHVMAQEGARLVGYAEPIKLKGAQHPHPESGGGRFRLTSDATGSTFTNVRWENRNLHCVVASQGSCVLFQDCSLRCEAFHYVSVAWACEGAFLAFKGCTIGGFSKKQQATNGVVLEGSTVLLDACKVEFCWGACVLVAMNSSAVVQHSVLVDSHAALAACDGKLHEGDVFLVDGSVELVNNTIKCVEEWRDEDRTKVYINSGNTWQEQDFPELKYILDKREQQTKLVWDEDMRIYVQCGPSDKDIRKETRFFDQHRRKGEANVPKIQKELRNKYKKPWESTSSSEEDYTTSDITDEANPKNTTLVVRKPKKEFNPYDRKMPANRHFHGITKGPRILKGRRNEYKFGRKM